MSLNQWHKLHEARDLLEYQLEQPLSEEQCDVYILWKKCDRIAFLNIHRLDLHFPSSPLHKVGGSVEFKLSKIEVEIAQYNYLFCTSPSHILTNTGSSW